MMRKEMVCKNKEKQKYGITNHTLYERKFRWKLMNPKIII